jgi:hypothetical protein
MSEIKDDWGHLPFAILAVHEGRTPAKEPPFHTPGGEWTFLDCQAGGGDPVRFTVGVLGRGKDDRPLVWGKAWLAAADRGDGARLVRLFAHAFSEDEPPSRAPQRPLKPLAIRTANLDDLRRMIDDNAGEPADRWHATKWFLGVGPHEAEVFFNYNVSLMRGEFAEKDPDYREDLLAILAIVLRDGPRPPRTPETDPNLTLSGPRIEAARRILARGSAHHLFSPGSRVLVYQDGNALFALEPGRPDNSVELARFEHPLWDVRVVNDLPDLLVKEIVPAKPPVQSSEDPARIWWVGHGKDKRLMRAPERWIDLAENALSPDGRYVALTHGKESFDRRLRYLAVCLVDLATGSTRTVEIPNRSLTPVGWKGEGECLRAVLVTNRWGPGRDRQEVFLADPAMGSRSLDPEPSTTVERLRGVVSPDGRYRAEIEDEERLVLTDMATKERRVFAFHEDDLPFVHDECVEWAGTRFLQLTARRVALIDAASMKMSFPAPEDEEGESSGYRFSPDLAWAAFGRETLDGVGLYLARVVVPGA